MTRTLYGIKACDTMKKARVWLDQNGVAYDFHDYKAAGANRAEVERWVAEHGWEKVLNRAGTTFRALVDDGKLSLEEAARYQNPYARGLLGLLLPQPLADWKATPGLPEDAILGEAVEVNAEMMRILSCQQDVAAMRQALPADTIIANGAGNFAGWWHRYWRYTAYPGQLAPTCGAMGYGVPAAVAAALRFPDRTVVAVAGDGDFLMNGQELATAVQHGCDLIVVLVDNGAYGTIRMHQEREFPERVCGTSLHNPDFAALAVAYGGWARRVETTAEFNAALAEAKERKGLRLLHLVIDVEQLSAGGATVSGLRAKAKG